MNLFIKKLAKEKKIKVNEPSNSICESYLKKSKKSLVSAKTLLEIGNYDDAIAMVYYSMYNSTLALCYKCGIKSENHTGTIILLKDLFGINNKDVMSAKKNRIDKQYYTDFEANKSEVIEGIKSAEEFNIKIKEFAGKINNEKAKYYNEKIKELLK